MLDECKGIKHVASRTVLGGALTPVATRAITFAGTALGELILLAPLVNSQFWIPVRNVGQKQELCSCQNLRG